MGDIRPIDEVIEALSICRNVDPYRVCRECPYPDTEGCMDMLMGDALFYLKEFRQAKESLESKRQILDFKIKMFEEQTELVQQQGKECEEHCQAEIARYLEAVKNCEKAENKYYMLCELNRQPNNPLTWEELKTMVGKPVWVEALLYKKWAIIAYVGDEHLRFEGVSLYAPESRVYMGKDNGWQAYRKERK